MDERFSALADLLGPEGTQSDPSALAAYAIDGHRPALALFPATAEQASLVLRTAGEHGSPLVPWGSGTKQCVGSLPKGEFAVVCSGKMDSILDFDPENLTVTAGAGTTLASIQARAATAGLKAPLDPPAGATATLGGILASGMSGPRRLLYGAPRDLALGLRAALPSGQVLKAGGKTVKNVAGYDLTRLFVGSWGTLGLIVDATIRLRPLPEEERTLVLRCETAERARDIVKAVLASPQLLPAALVLMNPAASALFEGQREWTPAGGYLVIVALEGFAEEVEAQTSRLSGLARLQVIEEKDRLREFLSYGVPGRVKARAGIPAGKLVALVRRLDAEASSRRLECPVVADAGSGSLSIYLGDDGGSSSLANFLLVARSLAESDEGYLVLEDAPENLKRLVSTWGDAGRSHPVMARVKQVFDPTGVMNPGRSIGGI